EKIVLSRRGHWDADGLVRVLVEHPALSSRLAWRICAHFFGPGVVPANAIQELAARLRENNLNIGSAVEVVLRSRLFFSADQLGGRFCPPASYIVATVRALEISRDGLAPEVAAAWMRALGQDLYYPPGVGGWP